MARIASPVLRAVVESGEAYDDPSEDLLFMLLEEVESGAGSWVIVEQIADATGQTFAQCLRLGDGRYQVEHRAGSADRHYVMAVPGYRETHEILTAWAFDLPAWRELEWAPLAL